MSPVIKSILLFAVLTILQSLATYLETDTSPTLNEGIKSVVISLVGAILFWTKSGRLPSLPEVQQSLITGNMKIYNDDPTDPVKLIVNTGMIPESVVVAASSYPSQLSKRD